MTKAYTNEIIDQKCLNLPVERIGEYLPGGKKIEWKCKKCNNNFYARAIDIFYKNGKGCLFCDPKRLQTKEEIQARIGNRPIKIIGEYLGNTIKTRFKCTTEKCDNEWDATTGHVLERTNPTGCPKCGGTLKYTNESIDEYLLDKPIKRIDDYVNCKLDMKFECKICFHEWLTKLDYIMNGNSGCHRCKTPGYNQKLILDFLKENNINFKYEFNIKNLNSTEMRNLRFDFYFPEYNTVIEYDGKQHFRPTFGKTKEDKEKDLKTTKERDIYKNNFCKANKINLIRIDGRKFTGIDLINHLKNNIIPTLQKSS